MIISTGARKSIQLSDQVFFPGFLSLQFGEKGIHLFAFNRVDQVLLVIDSTFMPDMQDLRITTGVEGIGLTTRWERISKQVAFRRVFRCYRKALIVEHKEPKELETGVYLLTRVGRELLDLDFEPNIEYMRLVGLAIAMKGFTVSLADWRQESEHGADIPTALKSNQETRWTRCMSRELSGLRYDQEARTITIK